MTDIQVKLQELRELVEGKAIGCPILVDAIFSGINDTRKVAELRVAHQNCPRCHGTGRIPDPDYIALLEVLREKCPVPHRKIFGKFHEMGCPNCHSTGYITRSWEGMPQGALAGALTVAVWPLHIHLDMKGELMMGNDPDLVAVERVIEMLKERV